MHDENRFKNFFITASALVGYQLTICMPYVICGVLIGRLGNSLSLSSYGLTLAIVNMGFYGFVMGIQESIGVVCSRLYGSGDYKMMWKYLWKSLLFVLVISGLFHLFSLFATKILIAISVDEKLAIASGKLLRLMSISLYLQGINEVMNNFLSAQNITKPLFYLNLISIGIVFSTGYLFINHLGYAELGYGYMKICQESFHMIYYIFVLIRYIDINYFERPNLKNIRDNFWHFLKENIYTTITFYGEFTAIEINTYYAVLLHSVDALATWVSYINATTISYFISVGLGAAMRNLVGKRIGELKIDKARKESISYLKYIGLISIFLIIIIYLYSDEIAGIFTTKEIVTKSLSINIKLFTIYAYFTLTIPSVNTLYRVLKRDRFIIWSNVVVYPASNIILNYLLCHYLQLGVIGLNLGFILTSIVMTITLLLNLYLNVNWKNIENIEVEMIQDDDNILDV